MQEVKVKNNEAGLSVYINGIPKLELVPAEIKELIIVGLELQLTEYFENKKKRNKKVV